MSDKPADPYHPQHLVNLEKLQAFIQKNKLLKTPGITILLIIGFLYLNGYLSEFDISFPLEISVLPTALIAIALISSSIFIAIALITLSLGALQYSSLAEKTHLLIHTDSNNFTTVPLTFTAIPSDYGCIVYA